jgi:hypothetical protein
MNYFKAVGYAALVSGLTLIGQAADAGDALLKAPLVACASDKTVIGGVNACGKIWKIGSGEATLNADGKLTVNIRGLVLNDSSVGKYDGSPDGVDAVAAAVVCRGKRGLIAAQTEPVALGQNGDVRISTTVSVPETCSDPIVLIRERYEGKIGGWLAATRQVSP